MPIIARISNKMNNIYKNELFTIKSIDRISNSIITTEDSDRLIGIKTETFQILFYIAFCMTVPKSQGSTFNHSYTVHEFDKFGNKLKFVALFRSSCIDRIDII